MSISSQAFCQLAGGPASRPYADMFPRHGVRAIGIGDPVPWMLQRAKDMFDRRRKKYRRVDQWNLGTK